MDFSTTFRGQTMVDLDQSRASNYNACLPSRMNWDSLVGQVDSLPVCGKVAIAGGAALSFYIPYKLMTNKPRKSPLKEDWKEGVVYLYQFPRMRNVPSSSPYCLKVETWLRMADIPYENVASGLTTRSREGTLPFVEINGVEYVDSALLIGNVARILRKSLAEHLSDEQLATSRAFEKLAENSLLQSHAIFKIENIDKVIESLPRHLFGGALFPLIAPFFRSSYVKKLKSVLFFTGYGKHSREDLIGIGSDDIRAISKYLGAKHYITGFKPTKTDATLFGVLANIVYAPYDNQHLELIRTECPNIMEYVERIKHRYWPDWGDATTNFSTDSNWKKRPRSRMENNGHDHK